MSLQDVVPNVRALSRADKLRLLQILAQDLAEGEAVKTLPALTAEAWSSCTDFAGAQKLAELLEAGKGAV